MYAEEIVIEINKLIIKLDKDNKTSLDTKKIAIHGLSLTREWIIRGMSYEYYLKSGEMPKLKNISHF